MNGIKDVVYGDAIGLCAVNIDLFLLAVEAEALGDALKWEVSRGGALFPHLYREFRLSDVSWAQPLPLADGKHQFPAGMAK